MTRRPACPSAVDRGKEEISENGILVASARESAKAPRPEPRTSPILGRRGVRFRISWAAVSACENASVIVRLEQLCSPSSVHATTPTSPTTGGKSGPKLIDFLCFRDTLVDRLATGEAFIDSVPVGDGFFAQLPAEQDALAFDLTGKIEQADAQIFHLHANGINLGESVLRMLFGAGALGLAPGQSNDIEKHPSVQKHAVMQGLQFCIEIVQDFLRLDGGAQQGFENGQ